MPRVSERHNNVADTSYHFFNWRSIGLSASHVNYIFVVFFLHEPTRLQLGNYLIMTGTFMAPISAKFPQSRHLHPQTERDSAMDFGCQYRTVLRLAELV